MRVRHMQSQHKLSEFKKYAIKMTYLDICEALCTLSIIRLKKQQQGIALCNEPFHPSTIESSRVASVGTCALV